MNFRTKANFEKIVDEHLGTEQHLNDLIEAACPSPVPNADTLSGTEKEQVCIAYMHMAALLYRLGRDCDEAASELMGHSEAALNPAINQSDTSGYLAKKYPKSTKSNRFLTTELMQSYRR